MSETNPNSRLEAFCDGVFAIALTLLIIDIKIPVTTEINNTADFWLALKHITPAIATFVLSFFTILIAWVNHHAAIKLVNKSSGSFIYANGFMLLTIVFMPFPTSLVGEYILTDHAAPAVILYDSVLALQALSWIIMSITILKNDLCKSEKAKHTLLTNMKFGYGGFVVYSMLAFSAFWFPFAVALLTTLLFVFWLIWGINMKHE